MTATNPHTLAGLRLADAFAGDRQTSNEFHCRQVVNDRRRVVASLYGDTPEQATELAAAFIRWAQTPGAAQS